MIIGDYEIYTVLTGLFRLDGGAMFGVVPKPLWSRSNPADDSNRIEMCTNALLLVSDKKKILIDTGIGHKLSKKLNDIYAVDYSRFTLDDSINKAGYNSSDITDVILTHLHFDHAGGCTRFDEEGKPFAVFNNAVHVVQEKHFEWACNPTDRDRASFIPDNYMPVHEAGMLKTVTGEYKFDDFITLIPVNGHTRNMQMVRISDGKNTMLYTADLIPMSSHIPLPYIMGYDLFPLITLEEKRNYLTEAVDNEWIIYFEHDPHTEAAKIGFNGNQFFLKEKISLKD